MKKSYFFLLIYSIIAICFIFPKEAVAYTVTVKGDGPYAEYISNNLLQYAEERAELFINEALSEEDSRLFEGIEIKKNTRITLRRPYVSWNALEQQDAVYNFPIVIKNKIVGILGVIGSTEDKEHLTANFPGDPAMVKKLNEIDYLHQDYVFYQYQGLIFAENRKEQIQIGDISSFIASQTEEMNQAEEEFYRLDYDQKLQIMLQKMKYFASYSPESTPEETINNEKQDKQTDKRSVILYCTLAVGVLAIGCIVGWVLNRKKVVMVNEK